MDSEKPNISEPVMDITGLISQEAINQGVDPDLALRVANAESGFDQGKVSDAGAIGVMQLMPGTAQDLGVDPSDLAQNIRGGISYLKQQLDNFGSPDLAVAAYNAGPGNVRRSGGIPNIAETRNYVTKVLGSPNSNGPQPEQTQASAFSPSQAKTPSDGADIFGLSPGGVSQNNQSEQNQQQDTSGSTGADIFGLDPETTTPQNQQAQQGNISYWDGSHDIKEGEWYKDANGNAHQWNSKYYQWSPVPEQGNDNQQQSSPDNQLNFGDSFVRGLTDVGQGAAQRAMHLMDWINTHNIPLTDTPLSTVLPNIGAMTAPSLAPLMSGISPIMPDIIDKLTKNMGQNDADISNSLRDYNKAYQTQNGSDIDWGRILGNATAGLPLMSIPGANTLFGSAAIGGALGSFQPVDTQNSDYASQSAGNIGGGLLGGIAGYGVGKLANSIFRPMGNLAPSEKAGVALADKIGINLTPGQRTGNPGLMSIEDQLSNIPGATWWKKSRVTGNQSTLNTLAAKSIGQDADAITPDVLGVAKNNIGSLYNKVYSPDTNIQFGPEFQQQIADIKSKYAPFGDLGQGVNNAIDKYTSFTGAGDVPGNIYQGGRTMLKNAADDALYSSSPNTTLGSALKDVQKILQENAIQSLPQNSQDVLDKADRMYSSLKTLTKGKSVTNGNVNPLSVANALQSYYGDAYKTGAISGPLVDIARLAEANKNWRLLNDSGTATRTFVESLAQNPLSAIPSAGIANLILGATDNPISAAYLTHGLPLLNQLPAKYPRFLPTILTPFGASVGEQYNK